MRPERDPNEITQPMDAIRDPQGRALAQDLMTEKHRQLLAAARADHRPAKREYAEQLATRTDTLSTIRQALDTPQMCIADLSPSALSLLRCIIEHEQLDTLRSIQGLPEWREGIEL